MRAKRQEIRPSTEDFLARNPVFSLVEFENGLSCSRANALERIRHHVATGRLKRVAKEVYAAVPRGESAAAFVPDRYLVAAAARPDGILSHHAALELMGVAHSSWQECTVLCARRRGTIELNGIRVRFLNHPSSLDRDGSVRLGVRRIERMGRSIPHTGPERTLIDGFRQPGLVGGLEELVESAAGFGVLDLELLERLLGAFSRRTLWACLGWFLERHQERFFVPEEFLRRLERERPRSAHYVPRGLRGGSFSRRWNLVLPAALSDGLLD